MTNLTKQNPGSRQEPARSRYTAGVYWKNLPEKKRKEFYKALITRNYTEAAIFIGLDKHYAPNTLRSVGYKLYNLIEPDKLGFGEDVVDMVKAAVESRKLHRGSVPNNDTGLAKPDPHELINPSDNKQVIIQGRNKAAMLLHKKMDRLSKSPRLLDGVSLTQLATTFGIFFDKAQIVQGQATENIAIMASISDDLTPEETLDRILKDRERLVADKHEK